MRILLFNDPHYSRHAPECRADSYPQEILAKFHQVFRIALKLGCAAVGCSGDWFHRKGKVTFREANDLLSVLDAARKKGLDVFGILGNHDVAGHALDSLDNRAVGSLVHSRVLQLLDHRPYSAFDDDGAVYVTGTSYFHGCDADDEARLKMYGAERPPSWSEGKGEDRDFVHVHLAHGTLLQKGSFFEDYTVAPELVELLAEHDRLPDVIVCGHLHFSEGVKLYDRPNGEGQVAVCRVGSLGRVSSEDFDRTPQVLVIAAKGGRFVCKAVPIGEDVKRGGETKGSRDPAESVKRIQEFVRVLREEADEWSLADHGKLLEACCEEIGHGKEVLDLARAAVERRQ